MGCPYNDRGVPLLRFSVVVKLGAANGAVANLRQGALEIEVRCGRGAAALAWVGVVGRQLYVHRRRSA